MRPPTLSAAIQYRDRAQAQVAPEPLGTKAVEGGMLAAAAIARLRLLNDNTCRDWQFRTREWLQGKNRVSTTPLGPWLVTPDEVGGVRPDLPICTLVDMQVMQEGRAEPVPRMDGSALARPRRRNADALRNLVAWATSA